MATLEFTFRRPFCYPKGLFYDRTALLDCQIAFCSRFNITKNPLKSTDDAFVNVMDAIVWLCLNCFMIGFHHSKCKGLTAYDMHRMT